MSSNSFIDVHSFDGTLKGIFKPSRAYSKDEKIKMFRNLINKLSCGRASFTVEIMINDLSKVNSGENYQPENDVDSSDVLAEILCKDYTDLLPILQEQLADVVNLGICPSGRVTRLLQIWSSLK